MNLDSTIRLQAGGAGNGCNPAVAQPRCGRPSVGEADKNATVVHIYGDHSIRDTVRQLGSIYGARIKFVAGKGEFVPPESSTRPAAVKVYEKIIAKYERLHPERSYVRGNVGRRIRGSDDHRRIPPKEAFRDLESTIALKPFHPDKDTIERVRKKFNQTISEHDDWGERGLRPPVL